MNKLENDLLLEAIERYLNCYYQKYLSNYFFLSDDFKSVKDLTYKLEEDIKDNPFRFVYDLSEATQHVKEFKKIAENRSFDSLNHDLEEIEIGLKTVVRGSKKLLLPYIQEIFNQWSEESKANYNDKVLSTFKLSA